MAKQRSGIPSGDSDNPQHKASDGWPTWMGDADPSLAPKPPPKVAPKPAAVPAAAPRKAVPVQSRAPAPPAANPPPAPAPRKTRSRIGLRIGIWAVVLLWAFVGGVIAARYQPDAAVRFQQAASDVQLRLGSLLPPAAGLTMAIGIPVLLFGTLVWQSGRPRRPRFLAFACFVCLATASIGMIRGGHDVDMDRNAADFRSKIHKLRQELELCRTLPQGLSALESKLQAADSDRARSSMSIQEHDELVAALRKEIEQLKKKLSEKN